MFIYCIQEILELQIDAMKLVTKIWQVLNRLKIDDIMRFMYEHKISMATLAGHGVGGKVALAAACYNYDKVTGYCGIDTSPLNHFYHEPVKELR